MIEDTKTFKSFISEKVWAEHRWGFPVLTTYRTVGNRRTISRREAVLLSRIATEIRQKCTRFRPRGQTNSGDFLDREACPFMTRGVNMSDVVGWGLFDFLEISGGDYASQVREFRLAFIPPLRECGKDFVRRDFPWCRNLEHRSNNVKRLFTNFSRRFSMHTQVPALLYRTHAVQDIHHDKLGPRK